MKQPSNDCSHTLPQPLVCAALVSLGVGLRLTFQEIPNFAPVAAVAMFAGYYFRDLRWAIATPLAVMAISDLVIGGYDLRLMATVYVMLTAPVLLRGPLRRWLKLDTEQGWSAAGGVAGLVGVSLLSSLAFYLVTNFAVWCVWYDWTAAELIRCYVFAAPFFRYTLLGDFTFALLLFSGYALALRYTRARPGKLVRQPVRR